MGAPSADRIPSRVAILAGGQGTRLAGRAGDLPKPMVPVAGKPVLQHQIELCKAHGFVDIALLVHHRHEAIVGHFGDGSDFGVRLHYEIEATPRGTAGALRDALPALAERFLLLYGDTYLDVDLGRFWRYHVDANAAATLFLHPNDHPHDSDLVDLGRDGRVRGILPYPHAPGLECRNLVNAALYVLEREGLAARIPADEKTDIAKHLFPALLGVGARLQGYVSPEYIKDMGTPERLDKVERDIAVGLPDRLSNRQPRSAAFLDRDGTLNREVNHLGRPEQLELLDGAATAVRRLNRAGQLAVVVTNQPVVARGEVSEDQLDRIHARLDALLGQGGAYLDALYHCPHHPDKGFAGEVAALKIDCTCRKPLPGMIDTACKDLNVRRAGSWMVGDSTADIEAGRMAGLRTILLRTGHAGRDDKHPLRPDYVCPDLPAAVDWILEGHSRMTVRLLGIADAAAGVRTVLVGGLARSGKSSVAQVLKEILSTLGRTAHVIALDGWLKELHDRPQGGDVVARYDLEAAVKELARVVDARTPVTLATAVYDRLTRGRHRLPVPHAIDVDDIVIVEGVPALLMPPLSATGQRSLKVHVETPEAVRRDRLAADYRWRGVGEQELDALLAARERDETAPVLQARGSADHVITNEASA